MTIPTPPSHLQDVCRWGAFGDALHHHWMPPEDYGVGLTRLRLVRCAACDAFVLRSIGRGDEALEQLLENAYAIETTGPLWPSIEAPGAQPIVLAPRIRNRRRPVPKSTPNSIRAERIREYLRRKEAPASVNELHRVLGIAKHALYSPQLRHVARHKFGIRVHKEPGRGLLWEVAA